MYNKGKHKASRLPQIFYCLGWGLSTEPLGYNLNQANKFYIFLWVFLFHKIYVHGYIYTREKNEHMVFEPETAPDVLSSGSVHSVFPCTTHCKLKLPQAFQWLILGHSHEWLWMLHFYFRITPRPILVHCVTSATAEVPCSVRTIFTNNRSSR